MNGTGPATDGQIMSDSDLVSVLLQQIRDEMRSMREKFDARAVHLETRISEIGIQITKAEMRLDVLAARLDGTIVDVRGHSATLAEYHQNLEQLRGLIAEHSARLVELTPLLDSRVDIERHIARFEDHHRRLDRVERAARKTARYLKALGARHDAEIAELRARLTAP